MSHVKNYLINPFMNLVMDPVMNPVMNPVISHIKKYVMNPLNVKLKYQMEIMSVFIASIDHCDLVI